MWGGDEGGGWWCGRGGHPARRLLPDSPYLLFNHLSLRDVLPSIHHVQKKFRCSMLPRDEGPGSGVDVLYAEAGGSKIGPAGLKTDETEGEARGTAVGF